MFNAYSTGQYNYRHMANKTQSMQFSATCDHAFDQMPNFDSKFKDLQASMKKTYHCNGENGQINERPESSCRYPRAGEQISEKQESDCRYPRAISRRNNHVFKLEEIAQQFCDKQYRPLNGSIFGLEQLEGSKGLAMKKYRQSVYYGQIVQGMRQGKGIMMYTNGRVYEGYWHQNFKHGKGYEKFDNGAVYQGNYVRGKPEGYGKYSDGNGESYEGEWADGTKNGSGIWRGPYGDSYIGEWRDGQPNGYGVHTWINGDRYEGQFVNCLKHGEGIEKFTSGDSYRGLYANGKPEGYGEYIWSIGSFYKGNFKNGLREGQGVWKAGPGNSDKYEGQYKQDRKQGYGVFVWANGNVYKGYFQADLRQGFGEMFTADGKSQYKGEWHQGVEVCNSNRLLKYQNHLQGVSVPIQPQDQFEESLRGEELEQIDLGFESGHDLQLTHFKVKPSGQNFGDSGSTARRGLTQQLGSVQESQASRPRKYRFNPQTHHESFSDFKASEEHHDSQLFQQHQNARQSGGLRKTKNNYSYNNSLKYYSKPQLHPYGRVPGALSSQHCSSCSSPGVRMANKKSVSSRQVKNQGLAYSVKLRKAHNLHSEEAVANSSFFLYKIHGNDRKARAHKFENCQGLHENNNTMKTRREVKTSGAMRQRKYIEQQIQYFSGKQTNPELAP